VSVYLGNGDGTFQSKVDYTTTSNTWGIAAADVNGDGIPDIEATSSSGRVHLL
jgi:VCBS repeat protein